MNPRLIIKSDLQTAELWVREKLERTYRVSTGAKGVGCEVGSFKTAAGKLKISKKIGDGLPLGAVLKSRIPTGEIWSQDPENPLSESSEDLVLTRVLWLEGAEEHNTNTLGRYIYIHGTNQPHLLGQPVSHGCIRVSNEDVLELYEVLGEGSEVEVI
jgi:L,D-transpeptidase YbiS